MTIKIAIIGRTQILYATACRLRAAGYEITCILTAKEAPEYTCNVEDFRRLAEQLQIPFICSGKIIECRDFFLASGANIAVSINYSGVIPKAITDVFPLGILNAHGGDLPRYRGNACQAWAILNGEDRIGLCIHKMIGGEIDSGDIVARDYFSINQNTKITAVLNWMSERIPSLMVESVALLRLNPDYFLERQSRDDKIALRCYPRRPEDGYINWKLQSNLEVLRLVNASNKPYAGAFCFYEERKMVIWDAELINDDENYYAIPGQVLKVGDCFIDVACAGGKIRIKKIQLTGEPEDWPNNHIKSIRVRLR